MYRELEPAVKASYERRAREGKKRDDFLRKVLEMGSSVPTDQVSGDVEGERFRGFRWCFRSFHCTLFIGSRIGLRNIRWC